jgi:hypothetical protein
MICHQATSARLVITEQCAHRRVIGSCSGWIVGFSKVRSAIILGCCRIGVWLIAAISDFFENVAGRSSLSGVLQTCPLTLSAVPLLIPLPETSQSPKLSNRACRAVIHGE